MTNTIMLIHGLWMTPSSWRNFRDFYETRGFKVVTPYWPHEPVDIASLRGNPSVYNGVGLKEIVDHHERIIRSLPESPILIGHSFGGLIVQLLLDRGLGQAGVAIDSAPPRGILVLPPAAVKVASYVLRDPRKYNGTSMLTFEQFQYACASTLDEEEARIVYERDAVPTPGRPMFQAAFAALNPRSESVVDLRNDRRAPLLLTGGTLDHAAPAELSRKNFELYRNSKAITAYKEFSGRSHLIVAEQGWQEVADYSISWVQKVLSRFDTNRRIA